MARNQGQLLRYPNGANDNSDPSIFADSKAAVMIGICPLNPGVGARIFWKKRVQLNASFAPSGFISGIFQYTADVPANDRMLLVKNGALYTCTVSANAPTTTVNALNFTTSQLTAVTNLSGVNFVANQRVRGVQLGDEFFFVQEGGLQPLRFNGTNLYLDGIVSPLIPTDGGNAVYTGPAPSMTVGALYNYAVTYADEKGRESSPSPYLTVTMGAGGGRVINWSAPSDAQVQRVFLYRTNAGGATLYRVVEAGFSIGTTTYSDTVVNDNLLVLNTLAPLPGQNDPPLPASIIAVYKFRLALNATSDPRLLQVSNLDEPGMFSQIGPLFNANGQLLNATDGVTFQVLNEWGDEITGLGHLGSVLGVFSRRTTGVLEGDSPAQYQYRSVHRVGCIAIDSIAECGNSTLFMSEDGIYALDYQSGFTINKVSEDYDNYFRSASVLFDPPGDWPPTQNFGRQQRASAAVAVYMQQRYVLATPPYTYVYDFSGNMSYLDGMTGMPYTNGDGNSDGYLSMGRVFVDRQYEVTFYSPGIGNSTPVGDLYVCSYYNLIATDPNVPEPFEFTLLTRAIDGAGVARSREKQFIDVSVYGKIEPLVMADGTVTSPALLSGTIKFIFENGLYETQEFFFDNIEQISTDFVGRYFQNDQVLGMLFQQCLPGDAHGRIMQIQISGSANGILTLSDILTTYYPTGG